MVAERGPPIQPENLPEVSARTSAAMAAGQSGQDDVYIDNATTVVHFQVILHRIAHLIDRQSGEIERTTHGTEQQLAQVRIDIQTLSQRPQASASTDVRVDLIDLKTMSPTVLGVIWVRNPKPG